MTAWYVDMLAVASVLRPTAWQVCGFAGQILGKLCWKVTFSVAGADGNATTAMGGSLALCQASLCPED